MVWQVMVVVVVVVVASRLHQGSRDAQCEEEHQPTQQNTI
jgi:hypothetical protein